MASRLGSGEGDKRSTAADREQGETDRKKEIYKYLRKRGEKNTAETRKHVQACVLHFTQYRGAWAVYCTFFYIYRGEYIIYIYIYNILPD